MEKNFCIYTEEGYTEPLCYELTGKSFNMFSENGERYGCSFVSKELLLFGVIGESVCFEAYKCLKLDESSYLVCLESTEKEKGCAVIIDLSLEIAVIVYKEKFSVCRLSEKDYTYELCTELTGHTIIWETAADKKIKHFFSENTKIAVQCFKEPSEKSPEESIVSLNSLKLREDRYLYCYIIEGNSYLWFCNLNKVHSIGRICTKEGQTKLFCGYGEFQREEKRRE